MASLSASEGRAVGVLHRKLADALKHLLDIVQRALSRLRKRNGVLAMFCVAWLRPLT